MKRWPAGVMVTILDPTRCAMALGTRVLDWNVRATIGGTVPVVATELTEPFAAGCAGGHYQTMRMSRTTDVSLRAIILTPGFGSAQHRVGCVQLHHSFVSNGAVCVRALNVGVIQSHQRTVAEADFAIPGQGAQTKNRIEVVVLDLHSFFTSPLVASVWVCLAAVCRLLTSRTLQSPTPDCSLRPAAAW